jgi:acyl-CoA reductase-like NAD-dependent aldehyde dehydrogenase
LKWWAVVSLWWWVAVRSRPGTPTRACSPALATGNAVIVKPHENAILPAAITVRTVRAVLSENGINPDLVTLCVPETRSATQQLVTHPAVRSVDFTGKQCVWKMADR